jgi:iron-sulfur cluster repair protein YtfE (RIC family)
MTTTPTHPGWTVQLAIHRAVRRDAARLSAALTEGRDTPPEVIRDYWNETAAQLHDHHVFEDTIVWPLMGERLGERVDALLARNAREHLAMATAMEDFDTTLSTMTTSATATRRALQHMVEAIETHLAHEEADVLPLIPEAFTLEDMAFFSTESAKTNPPEAFLPWVLDNATVADLDFFTRIMPAPIRTELESHWIPQRRIKMDALQHPDLEPAAT